MGTGRYIHGAALVNPCIDTELGAKTCIAVIAIHTLLLCTTGTGLSVVSSPSESTSHNTTPQRQGLYRRHSYTRVIYVVLSHLSV